MKLFKRFFRYFTNLEYATKLDSAQLMLRCVCKNEKEFIDHLKVAIIMDGDFITNIKTMAKVKAVFG